MDSLDNETVERIPWETLEAPRADRTWLVYAVSGAVVIGALSYSFFSNRPVQIETTPPAAEVAVTQPPAPTPIDTTAPAAVASPVVVAEADLFAVDTEDLRDAAATHALWFAVEYIAQDGSETSREVLASLMPDGVPLPETEEGAQVFVDFAAVMGVDSIAAARYEVRVLIRSLVSGSDASFTRVSPRVVSVSVGFDDQGRAHVVEAPSVALAVAPTRHDLVITTPPEEVVAATISEGEILVGAVPTDGGGWRLIVMREGIDGVVRPTTVATP